MPESPFMDTIRQAMAAARAIQADVDAAGMGRPVPAPVPAPERQFAGADWLQAQYPAMAISELGIQVANLLGDLFYGLYHLDGAALARVDWTNKHSIAITIYDELATFDTDRLTALVILCHDRMIRCALRSVGNGYMRLTFHQRYCRAGRQWKSHPTLEAAAAHIRARYQEEADHAS